MQCFYGHLLYLWFQNLQSMMQRMNIFTENENGIWNLTDHIIEKFILDELCELREKENLLQ